LLPVQLPEEQVRELMTRKEITVDLETRTVDEFAFALDDFTRDCLLNGWDDIALTLQHEDAITAFEAAARA
jgi:3-isopropylmalate dehydratase small subunit